MQVLISFNGMESSEALKKYVSEKIHKYDRFLSDSTSIAVVLNQSVHTKGVKSDFGIDINVALPKTMIRVAERGADMYALIDMSTDILARRLKRYHDKKKNWEGESPWKVTEENEVLEDETDSYISYTPKISKRMKLSDMTPMDEGEAIEKMLMMGYQQILFRNKKDDKISMIYVRRNGEYGIVQPSDELALS